MVPDIPESLDIKIKRERYLAKEALQDAEHVKDRQRRLTEGTDMDRQEDGEATPATGLICESPN